MWLRKEKVRELKKNQVRMGCLASFPFPGLLGSTLSVLPSLWASVDGALVLPEMQ